MYNEESRLLQAAFFLSSHNILLPREIYIQDVRYFLNEPAHSVELRYTDNAHY